MKKILLLAFFAINAAQMMAQDNARWVAAESGLRLRETPDPQGKVVGAVPYGAEVALVKKTETVASKNYTIEKQKGKFVRVKYGKKQGFVFDAFLQNYEPAPKNVQLYVVAASGLRFREKADANSTVLATIPFGDSVKTDGAMGELWQIMEKTPKNVFKVENISGFWQKVVYKGKKGFVFSGFVSQYYKPETVTASHIFLEEGWGCGMIVQNTADYNWFGWYKKGDKTELKTITKPSFSISTDDEVGISIITRTDRTLKGDTAMYIIGVRKTAAQQIAAGKIKGKWCATDDYDADAPFHVKEENTVFKFENTTDQLRIAITKKPKTDEYSSEIAKSELFFEREGKKQSLLVFDDKKQSPDNAWFFGVDVLWYGDLDGDGKLDLLFNTEGEMDSSYQLYLSSAAGKGQYLRRVGAIYSCGC
jgi:Bacterial SH3 domain